MRTTILCLLLSAVAISANLQSDIDDVISHLPLQQMELIGQKYIATYPSIRAALEYLQTVGDEKIFNDVIKFKQVNDMFKYLNSRGIDGEGLARHLIKMSLAFHRKLLEQPTGSSLPAITGDFNADIIAVIKASDIATVIKEKAKTSPEFANFLAVVTSPEFKTLFFRGVNTRAIAIEDKNGKAPNARGFFKKVWQKVKDVGFGIGVSIPLGK